MSRAVTLLLSALALVAAAAGAGCGVGTGEAPDEIRLTVTDRFGQRSVVEAKTPEVRGNDTVMRLLQRNAKIRTRYGGAFVHEIDGLSGGQERGRPVDWFYYRNGVLVDRGATALELEAGDRVWWDRRDWGVTMTVPAVVGSFPEPFVHGFEGERAPTRLECDEGVDEACGAVQRRLLDLGLTVGRSRPGTEGGSESLRIIVGRWPEIRADRALLPVEEGPKVSGVYARMSEDGRTLTALDERGAAARELGAGTGLIAATRWRDEAPTWMVTGTDAAGVVAAARSFDEAVLDRRFAVAVTAGRPLPVPVPAAGDGGDAR